jgi:hypothetical protein
VEPNDILHGGRWARGKPVTQARHLTYYLLREDGVSIDAIANVMNRTRASVMKSLSRLEDLASRGSANPELANVIFIMRQVTASEQTFATPTPLLTSSNSQAKKKLPAT